MCIRDSDHTVYPRPDSRYGVSKVFGEALGSLYADKYGMEVFMMRIGNVGPKPLDKRRLSIWFSPRDLAQLVSIGIDKPGNDAVAEMYQGGVFCSAEDVPNPAAPKGKKK